MPGDLYFDNKPPRGTSYEEFRQLRLRQAYLDSQQDLAQSRKRSHAVARRLVEVYDGGMMPATGDHFFACHPVALNGAEFEGGTATPVVTTGTEMFVDFLYNAPAVGDLAVAYEIGGRWVAEKFGCCETFTVQCFTEEIEGATVTVKLSGVVVASGVTNSLGKVTLCIPAAGTYLVTATATGYTSFTGNLALSCGGAHILPLCQGIGCPGVGFITCNIPENLFLTDANGTIPFTWDPSYDFGAGAWLGSYSIVMSNVITGGGTSCGSALTVGTASININYLGQCVIVGDSGYFRVIQSFVVATVQVVDGVAYYCGAFNGLTCTFSSCLAGICIPATPANYLCAPTTTFGGVSGSTMTEHWTTCSPFAWSGTAPSDVGFGGCGVIPAVPLANPAGSSVTVSG